MQYDNSIPGLTDPHKNIFQKASEKLAYITAGKDDDPDDKKRPWYACVMKFIQGNWYQTQRTETGSRTKQEAIDRLAKVSYHIPVWNQRKKKFEYPYWTPEHDKRNERVLKIVQETADRREKRNKKVASQLAHSQAYTRNGESGLSVNDVLELIDHTTIEARCQNCLAEGHKKYPESGTCDNCRAEYLTKEIARLKNESQS